MTMGESAHDPISIGFNETLCEGTRRAERRCPSCVRSRAVAMSEPEAGNSGKRKIIRRDYMLGAAMLVAGLAIVGVAVIQMGAEAVMQAQATPPASTSQSTSPPPPPSTPPSSTQDEKPAEARPTTPAPEPARPQPTPDATPNSPPNATTGGSATGAAPPAALPPAPAEKLGEPLKK